MCMDLAYHLDYDQAQRAPRVSRGYFWHELSWKVCVALGLWPARAEHYNELRKQRIIFARLEIRSILNSL
jgi:hypothetical protein